MTATDYSKLPATSFGSAGEMETRLAALILAERKRATVWDGNSPNETAPGMLWRVTANGRDIAVIETLTVERRRFDEIDEAFAYEEGEGDRSLLFWQLVHEKFFRNEGHFSHDMLLWCERFKLVAVIDHDLAQRAADHVVAEEAEAKGIMEDCRRLKS